MSYDKNNIFAKILRGEIPCKKIYENEYILSFYDINPQRKVHALVVPKGEYIDLDDFSSRASEKEISENVNGVLLVRHFHQYLLKICSPSRHQIKRCLISLQQDKFL